MTPQELLNKVFKENTSSDTSKNALKACEIALEAYNLPQQSHVHSVEVALIIADLNLDEGTIIATLISDRSLETIYSDKNIADLFGDDVAELTKGIRKLNAFKEFSSASISNQAQSESMRQMLLAMTSDIRMMIVKLAFRVARLRNLKNEPEEVRYLIANETQLIFAPLANRLGIAQLKWELEDLSFRYTHPDIYRAIALQLDSKRTEREAYIDDTIQTLKEMFSEKFLEESEHFRITGRPKHLYSIWKKMTRKNLPIDELYDLRAVRIYVDTIEQCYEVLGMIHSRWNYVKTEFDDYIARAKENGYQSIHTVIYGKENKTVEIQIRTQEMHHSAEYGVAAHWRYKEGAKHIDQSLEESINLVRQMLEYNDNPDLLNEISTELQSEHIYVMTLSDEVVTLRKGSTPLDFAYYIHTKLGHRCRGAKVNGRIVPLTYQLCIGDKVEVLTIKDGSPSRNWLNPNLNYLGTSRARTKVRSWFNQQDREINIEAGESLFNKEIKRLHAQHIDVKKIVDKFRMENKATLFENIGRGQINERQLNSTIQRFITPYQDLGERARQSKLFEEAENDEVNSDLTAYVVGAPQLQTRLAPCCQPIEQDDIIGFVTRGRGITVHSKLCNNILNLNYDDQQRLIRVRWSSKKIVEHTTIVANLEILCFDRKALLKDIFTLMTKFDINLTSSKTTSDQKDGSVSMQFCIELSTKLNIGELLDSIETISNVEMASIDLS